MRDFAMLYFTLTMTLLIVVLLVFSLLFDHLYYRCCSSLSSLRVSHEATVRVK